MCKISKRMLQPPSCLNTPAFAMSQTSTTTVPGAHCSASLPCRSRLAQPSALAVSCLLFPLGSLTVEEVNGGVDESNSIAGLQQPLHIVAARPCLDEGSFLEDLCRFGEVKGSLLPNDRDLL